MLDFFAGSGTTAQAVLELNFADGGDRGFIMVSSTEATEKEPDKNICRDVCAPRVSGVIAGYGKQAGTGGGFAYLRAQKLLPETLAIDLRHDQIWLALQLIHSGTVTPYSRPNRSSCCKARIAPMSSTSPNWMRRRGAS